MSLSLSLLAVLMTSPAAAADAPKTPAPVVASTATFDCRTPAGWSRIDEDDGVTFLGPRGPFKLAAQIGIRYEGPDGLDPDAAAYVARLTRKTESERPGHRTYPPESLKVAGRAAQLVRKDASEYVPLHSAHPDEVPMRREIVVVPAKKGYYVILYYAPRAIAMKNRDAFVKTLASFKPRL